MTGSSRRCTGSPEGEAAGAVDAAPPPSETRDLIITVCRRLASANFEDMELDKQIDFDSEDVIAGRAQLRAALLHSTLRTAICLTLSSGAYHVNTDMAFNNSVDRHTTSPTILTISSIAGEYTIDGCNSAVQMLKKIRALEDLVADSKSASVLLASSKCSPSPCLRMAT